LKTILEFDNEDHFDEMKMMRCLKATDAYLALWDLRQRLRNINESTEEESTSSIETNKKFNSIYDYFFEILKHYNINLDREID
jgi:hypothetical protein